MPTLSESGSFYDDDMIKVVDRLPYDGEHRCVKHLVLQASGCAGDDELADALHECPHLETLVVSGVQDLTDRTVVRAAAACPSLQGVNLSGCASLSDVAVLELAAKGLPLQWIHLNGVAGLTDPSVSAVARSCSRLLELELCDLPLVSALSLRDVWMFSRQLRTLRVARCHQLNDKAFPSSLGPDMPNFSMEKPLPPRPTTWLDELQPLTLHHTAHNLRVLDLTSCNITDDAIEGIVAHAPRIQSFILSGCSDLTDRALESISKLGPHLDVLMLAHVNHITDKGIIKIARACQNIRCVDVAFCRHLSDLSVFELAALKIRRLSLVRVHKLTDIAIFALAEHAQTLERLHLSYCDRISLDAIHLLLKRIPGLQHLTATGVPACRRKGVQRFSDRAPEDWDKDQQAAYRVFNHENVAALRRFLDKEQARMREAEEKNIIFKPREDDKLDLY
ncbi:hypothetical protein BD626DRAFT_554717 [Schizophyllum amplum]|uniref:F-box/LRR-repeat protein 15-like leucin rich repeat domain-containing protein n=1 Tax=Schizophyllum amplum TaxID=97359 RepID=A0A550CS74_9AGAR|nr:hypothetical protein BD626DRAFT_554717 [Auriculariopsis ampla]